MGSSQLYVITAMAVLAFGAGGTFVYRWYKNRSKNLKRVRFEVDRDLGACLVGKDCSIRDRISKEMGVNFHIVECIGADYICTISASTQLAIDNCMAYIEELLQKERERVDQCGFEEVITLSKAAYKRLSAYQNRLIRKLCIEENIQIIAETPPSGNVVELRISGNHKEPVFKAKTILDDKVKEIDELERSLGESSAKRTPRLASSANNSTDIVLPEREKLEPAGADGTMEVYVSALASPHRFWMQILGPQAAALDNLVETMTEYYNKEENREIHTIISPQVGQIVAAMFNVDGKWYRAQVQEIKPNDYVPCQPVLDLYFVDYGDNCYAGPSEVFELRPDFLTLRFQAIECFLANVSPPNAVDGNDNCYPDESIEKFEQLAHVARWKKLWSRVVSYRERDGAVRAPSPSESLVIKGANTERSMREGSPVPGVELYDNEDGCDINIAEELIRGGYAQPSISAKGITSFSKPKSNRVDKDLPNKASPNIAKFEDHSKVGKKTSTDLVNREKSTDGKATVKSDNERKNIRDETKSFIDGISKDAVKVVETVRQSAEESVGDSVQSVKDRVAKVQSKLEETKSFIDGISKDAEKIVGDGKTAVKSSAVKPKTSKVVKTGVKTDIVNNGKTPENASSKQIKSDEQPSSPKATALKTEVDFMPAFGKTEKTKKVPQSPSEIKNKANDFLKSERNSKNGI